MSAIGGPSGQNDPYDIPSSPSPPPKKKKKTPRIVLKPKGIYPTLNTLLSKLIVYIAPKTAWEAFGMPTRSFVNGALRSQRALPLTAFWTGRSKDLFDITPMAPEEVILISLQAGLRAIVPLRQHCCKPLVLLGRINAFIVGRTRTCGTSVLERRARLVLAASIAA